MGGIAPGAERSIESPQRSLIQSVPRGSPEYMADPHDRSDRFELIAACEGEQLASFANEVLEDDPPLSIRQDPRPKLLMQRVQEPVERRPFNLGEVVVTPAEVELSGTRGFAMVPGHDRTPTIVEALQEVETRQRDRRRQSWAESLHTAVEFETIEDQQ